MLQLQKSLTEWNYKKNLLKNLSIQWCKKSWLQILRFFVAEWALQH